MKIRYVTLLAAIAGLMAACGNDRKVEPGPSLKEAASGKFLMGVALNVRQAAGQDTYASKVVKRHFNSIVAENCMKCEEIHPAEDKYFWDDADRFVKFGEENGMAITGHCLIWHSQMAPWFTKDSVGNLVDAETMKQRMKEHIYTIMGRYKGRIRSWDVVNEAIEGDGSYRQSDFYKILGPEYIPLAFQYAHEADPDAEYEKVIEIDLSALEPTVSYPHLPENTHPASEGKDIKIDQVVIGSCTNGRLEDMEAAYNILKGKHIAKGVRGIIIPATMAVYKECILRGWTTAFIDAGCIVSTPTCGPCLGGYMGILAEGERCVSTTNRNFVGRMGHVKSEVYLASPATAAASALTGYITDPRTV